MIHVSIYEFLGAACVTVTQLDTDIRGHLDARLIYQGMHEWGPDLENGDQGVLSGVSEALAAAYARLDQAQLG